MESTTNLAHFCQETQLSTSPRAFLRRPDKAHEALNVRSANAYVAAQKTKLKQIPKHLDAFGNSCSQIVVSAMQGMKQDGARLLQTWGLKTNEYMRNAMSSFGTARLHNELNDATHFLTSTAEKIEESIEMWQKNSRKGLQAFESSRKCVDDLTSCLVPGFHRKRIRELARRAVDSRLEAAHAELEMRSREESVKTINTIVVAVREKRDRLRQNAEALHKEMKAAAVALEDLCNRQDDVLIGERLPGVMTMKRFAARVIDEQLSRMTRNIIDRAATNGSMVQAIREESELVAEETKIPSHIAKYIPKNTADPGAFLADRDIEAREWAPSDELVDPGRPRRRVRVCEVPGGMQAGEVAEILLRTNPEGAHTIIVDNDDPGSIMISFEERFIAPSEIRELQLAEDFMAGRISPERRATMVTIFDDEVSVTSYRPERRRDADRSEEILGLALAIGLVSRHGQVYRLAGAHGLARVPGCPNARIGRGYQAAVREIESSPELRKTLSEALIRRCEQVGAVKVRAQLQAVLNHPESIVPKEFVSHLRKSLRRQLRLLPAATSGDVIGQSASASTQQKTTTVKTELDELSCDSERDRAVNEIRRVG